MTDSSSGTSPSETQKLALRLLDAVKQCQIRFGGRTELATDGDSSVSCLCAQFEAVMQHGMRRIGPNPVPPQHGTPSNYSTGGANISASSSDRGSNIMTVRDVITSLNVNINLNFKSADTQPVFWEFVREFLTRHEQERYILLKHVGTDVGRGRAWLRSSLNEHSLERYMNMFLADTDQLARFYSESAFMRDQEKSNLLPNVAAGLGSILFAININCADLNSAKPISNNLTRTTVSSSVLAVEEPCALFANPNSDLKAKDKRKKKRVATHIVSFDDEEVSSSERSKIESMASSSAPPTCLSSPTDLSIFRNRGRTKLGSTSDAADDSVFVESTCADSTNNCLVELENGSSCDEERPMSNGIETNWEYTVLESQVETARSSASESSSPAAGLAKCDGEQTKIVERRKASSTQTKIETHSFSSGYSVTNHLRLRIPFFTYSSEGKSSPEQRDVHTSLTPVNDTSVGELFPLTTNDELKSEDSVSIPSFNEDVDNVTCAATAPSAQRAFDRASSNCSTTDDDNISSKSSKMAILADGDLRQALFMIMQKKDEVDEQNRSLRSLMEKEMEMSATLRVENDELRLKHQEKFDKVQSRLQALSRENELLKHQLRKYVGAVQMLKRDGTEAHEAVVGLNRDGQVSSSDGLNYIDYHYESTEYEKKLIQVAEMHGELMEFNERLHRLLSQKEHMVRRLREELVDLRGPLPDDAMTSDDDISITSDYDASSMTTSARALINVWIPSAFLTGKSSDVHHVYQVYIRIRDDEWNVYRRYAQFYALHKDLKKKDAIVNTFEFPPKKVLGNKDAKFVEERRKRLQHYLRCVMNCMMQSNADLATNPDKETLTSLMPFFGEFANPANRHRNRQRRGQNHVVTTRQPSTPQYTGL